MTLLSEHIYELCAANENKVIVAVIKNPNMSRLYIYDALNTDKGIVFKAIKKTDYDNYISLCISLNEEDLKVNYTGWGIGMTPEMFMIMQEIYKAENILTNILYKLRHKEEFMNDIL